ncbi:MAG: FHA domain containing protein [uncultured Solirubrobacteraceae bacterium]|uniref:FHA domain containing protein n=1 Tax=uncultured Solirubrobacteraceae bacterium TaxID=1162706 RepID=A0A6J4U3I6_9ACTN|nr:MAG: FHA domain containing protein [uncultured Solirubrobacteraceae bacterium]
MNRLGIASTIPSAMHLIVDGKQVALAEGTTRIGRSPTADICLEDASVSRRHAIVLREGDSVRVLDDRSLNGVFVNGERVTAKVLEDGDVLALGRNELTFGAPATRSLAA